MQKITSRIVALVLLAGWTTLSYCAIGGAALVASALILPLILGATD